MLTPCKTFDFRWRRHRSEEATTTTSVQLHATQSRRDNYNNNNDNNKKLLKVLQKTDFKIECHLRVIQGQSFLGYWKVDKALHDAA